MFIPIRFRTSIQLPISELHGDFDEILLTKLQEELEGKCSRFGFIKPDTLVIESRSCGKFIKQHFNGYVIYEVICRSDVCNPAKDSRVEATVKNKNALGILAESNIKIHGKDITILDIIVPRRAAGIVSEIDLDSLNIGDTFNVMVMGKSYQLNDSKISIIGRGVHSLTNKAEDIGERDLVEPDEKSASEDGDGSESDAEGQESDDKESTGGDDPQHSDDEKIISGVDIFDDVLGGEDLGIYGGDGDDPDGDGDDEEAEGGGDEDDPEGGGAYDDY